ncbi:hypothetical protein [Agrobacterium vitis]|uniref:hypothetical protein n=1 Tax=Agrobacterium vitis TaxID=373 RepID=UPI003D2CFC66
MWLVSLDPASCPTSDHEQLGTCSVLIISRGPFNRLTKTPVVLGMVGLGARIPPLACQPSPPQGGDRIDASASFSSIACVIDLPTRKSRVRHKLRVDLPPRGGDVR